MATPLSRKLGIKPGHRVALINFDGALPALDDSWPDGALRLDRPEAPMDVIILFALRSSALDEFATLQGMLTPAGGLWVAWPKKASKVPTDLDFNRVQHHGLDCGLVDNKVCAIDTTWSGVRFVWRLADRPKETR